MSIARVVIVKAAVDLVARGAGLITFPILARYAGPDGYGAWSQVNTVVGLLIPFASLGLSGALVRFFAGLEWDIATRRRALKVNLVVALAGAMFAAAMATVAPLINDLFLKWPEGEALFRWGAALVALGALSQLQLDFLRARQRLFYFSLVQLAEALAMIAATALVLPAGYGLVALIQLTALIKLAILVFVLAGLYTWDRPAETRGPEAAGLAIGGMVRFGMPLVVSGLGLWMMTASNRLVIGYYLPVDAVGLYSAAATFAALIVAFNSPLLLPLYPRLMRAVASHSDVAVLDEVRLFHRYMSLVLIPAAAYLTLILGPLLELLGGRSFQSDGMVIIPLVLALFFDQWNGIAHYVLMCKDRVVFIQNAWILAGIANVAANLLLVPSFGLRGAAFVTLATYAALEAAFFVAANRMVDLGSGYRYRVSLKALAASAVAAAVTLAAWGPIRPTVADVVLASVIFGVACLSALALFREIGPRELRSVANALFLRRGP